MNDVEFPLNRRALELWESALITQGALRISGATAKCGTTIVDFGLSSAGGNEAGIRLAEICMGGLGRVSLVPSRQSGGGAAVQVTTDQPVAACMASQYAGWQVTGEKFFAMGSGPMRTLARREPLFESLGIADRHDAAIGVLETSKSPPDDVCRDIAAKCGVDPNKLTLCIAPTASLAGTIQVVARSVETALHKLNEIGFPIERVQSGYGVAPLPPIAKGDLAAIGRTNDAILYGGEVVLWVECDDDQITSLGPRVPSSASADHGRPFAEIFARYGGDFYKIDPLLFSPAVVVFNNLASGRSFRYGRVESGVLAESFSIET